MYKGMYKQTSHGIRMEKVTICKGTTVEWSTSSTVCRVVLGALIGPRNLIYFVSEIKVKLKTARRLQGSLDSMVGLWGGPKTRIAVLQTVSKLNWKLLVETLIIEWTEIFSSRERTFPKLARSIYFRKLIWDCFIHFFFLLSFRDIFISVTVLFFPFLFSF